MFLVQQSYCNGPVGECGTLDEACAYAKKKGFDCKVIEVNAAGMSLVGTWSVFEGYLPYPKLEEV